MIDRRDCLYSVPSSELPTKSTEINTQPSKALLPFMLIRMNAGLPTSSSQFLPHPHPIQLPSAPILLHCPSSASQSHTPTHIPPKPINQRPNQHQMKRGENEKNRRATGHDLECCCRQCLFRGRRRLVHFRLCWCSIR